MITPIDNTIEHLKGQDPYDKTGAYRIWEAFHLLWDDLNNLSQKFDVLKADYEAYKKSHP